MKGAKDPFHQKYPYYAIIEIASSGAGSNTKHDNDLNRLMTFVESISDNILDGVVP